MKDHKIEDRGKSFRQISRDTGTTTPTVSAKDLRDWVRFYRMSIFDFRKVNNNDGH